MTNKNILELNLPDLRVGLFNSMGYYVTVNTKIISIIWVS